MSGESLKILPLILQAGPVVKAVIFCLIGMSVYSFAIIIERYRMLKKVQRRNQKFYTFFHKHTNLMEVAGVAKQYDDAPFATVFLAGFTEWKALGESQQNAEHNVPRALESSIGEVRLSLEKRLGFLASTASAAPFIGLFGTVWGIMNAFRDIGAAGSASLTTVAPGIAEALIATAFGLIAAIPAVMAYNVLMTRLKAIARQMEFFAAEFLNRLARNADQ